MRSHLSASIIVSMSLSSLSPAVEPYWLGTQAGPEDIVVTEWKAANSDISEPLAVTSVARRSLIGLSAVRGFQFISLKEGRPVLCNDSPHLPKGAEALGPWQGLSWQPQCKLARGGGMLAASRAEARMGLGSSEKLGVVDFFTWDRNCVEPKLNYSSSTPALGEASGGKKHPKCFNSITLARDGTVYASVMSFKIKEGPAPVVVALGEPLSGLVQGAIYVWRPEWKDWKLAAKQIDGANGILLSTDEKLLHISSALTARVLTFARGADGSLRGPMETLKLPGNAAPDNLRLCADDGIAVAYTSSKWKIGGHMVLKSLFGCSFGLGPRGHVHVWSAGHPESHQSASLPKPPLATSTAVPFGSWWLIGQIFDRGILCVPDEQIRLRH